MINHYRVLLPDTKKTTVSADIFFPPLNTEGASPFIHHLINQHLIPLQSQQTSIDYTFTNKGKSTDDLLRKLMRENPQEADDLADDGHESISRILLADFKDGKSNEYLGAPCWVYNDKDMAYRQALPEEPDEDDIESFDGYVRTAIPDDHFFEEVH